MWQQRHMERVLCPDCYCVFVDNWFSRGLEVRVALICLSPCVDSCTNGGKAVMVKLT